MGGPPADARPDDVAAFLAEELRALAVRWPGPRPAGWHLPPEAVLEFILGSDDGRIAPKLAGFGAAVRVAVATLEDGRALLIVGAEASGASLLADLLGLAISGPPGAARVLVAPDGGGELAGPEGPFGPLGQAMAAGRLVRVERLDLTTPFWQRALARVLDERRLPFGGRFVVARPGFGVIAPLHPGVAVSGALHPALRRRFNVVTLDPGELGAGRPFARRRLPADPAAIARDVAALAARVAPRGPRFEEPALQALASAVLGGTVPGGSGSPDR